MQPSNRRRTQSQNSKPRPPTGTKKGKVNLTYYRTLLGTQHRLTTPLHTSRYSARFALSHGMSICSVWPGLPMSCMAVSIHVRWGRPMGLGGPGMECAKNSCLTITSLGLRAATTILIVTIIGIHPEPRPSAVNIIRYAVRTNNIQRSTVILIMAYK